MPSFAEWEAQRTGADNPNNFQSGMDPLHPDVPMISNMPGRVSTPPDPRDAPQTPAAWQGPKLPPEPGDPDYDWSKSTVQAGRPDLLTEAKQYLTGPSFSQDLNDANARSRAGSDAPPMGHRATLVSPADAERQDPLSKVFGLDKASSIGPGPMSKLSNHEAPVLKQDSTLLSLPGPKASLGALMGLMGGPPASALGTAIGSVLDQKTPDVTLGDLEGPMGTEGVGDAMMTPLKNIAGDVAKTALLDRVPGMVGSASGAAARGLAKVGNAEWGGMAKRALVGPALHMMGLGGPGSIAAEVAATAGPSVARGASTVAQGVSDAMPDTVLGGLKSAAGKWWDAVKPTMETEWDRFSGFPEPDATPGSTARGTTNPFTPRGPTGSPEADTVRETVNTAREYVKGGMKRSQAAQRAGWPLGQSKATRISHLSQLPGDYTGQEKTVVDALRKAIGDSLHEGMSRDPAGYPSYQRPAEGWPSIDETPDPNSPEAADAWIQDMLKQTSQKNGWFPMGGK